METIRLDCSSCAVAGPACSDCVVSVLLGSPGVADDAPILTDVDQWAVANLAAGGLLPPLRLVRGDGGVTPPGGPLPDGREGLRRVGN